MRAQIAALTSLVALLLSLGLASSARRVAPPPDPSGPASLGPSDAPVVVLAVMDFECPFCARVVPVLAQLAESFPRHVRIQILHSPLGFHPNALPAAIAAVAAHRQGRYWRMHDALFFHQQALAPDTITSLSRQVGLDVARFEADRADPSVRALVEHDKAVARALGAFGTPEFFINGRVIEGAQPYAVFKQHVDEALAEARKAEAKGLRGQSAVEAAMVATDPVLGRKLADFLFRGIDPPPAPDPPGEDAEPPDLEGDSVPFGPVE